MVTEAEAVKGFVAVTISRLLILDDYVVPVTSRNAPRACLRAPGAKRNSKSDWALRETRVNRGV